MMGYTNDRLRPSLPRPANSMVRLRSAQKMALARLACGLVLSFRRVLGLPDRAVAKRGGLLWELDLSEGIDFSIFLLGAFEPSTVRLYQRLVKPEDTVLDIGGNIGAHTLPLARLVGPRGRVIAFEPTAYAIRKMRANVALNAELCDRISVRQVMLVADDRAPLAPKVYSSWPLCDRGGEVHRDHGGQLMDTNGAAAMTLDSALQSAGAGTVHFIKMDVDGHEHEVLSGAIATIQAHQPRILMELAPYLYEPEVQTLDDMLDLLKRCGYSMQDVGTHRRLPFDAARLRELIPAGQSCNVLLLPTAIRKA
jgi:FkbM family methyltransferase